MPNGPEQSYYSQQRPLIGLKQAITWAEGPDTSDPGYVRSMVDLAMQQLQTQGFPEAKTTTAKPLGQFGKFAWPGALALANPFTGHIKYDEENMRHLPPGEIADTMAHELTHTRQIRNTPWYKRPFAYTTQTGTEYRQRPWEKEAYATEGRRKAARRDIQLPSE